MQHQIKLARCRPPEHLERALTNLGIRAIPGTTWVSNKDDGRHFETEITFDRSVSVMALGEILPGLSMRMTEVDRRLILCWRDMPTVEG